MGGEAPLSDEEFVALVGDKHPYFGLLGGSRFYVRHLGKVLEGAMRAHLSVEGVDWSDSSLAKDPKRMAQLQRRMMVFTTDMIPDDTPVLCGDGSEEIRSKQASRRIRKEKEARRAAERAAYEKTCEACTLPGGDLLQAIYDREYVEQDRIGRDYIFEIGKRGGDRIMAAGVMMSRVATGRDLTLLEDLIGYYMLSTSRRWDEACYGPGSKAVTFTTKYPDQVYETLGGIEVGRDPGFTRITAYRIRPKFSRACDQLCNKNGGVLLTAKMASGRGEEIDAVKVFRGLDAFIDKYACDSPETRRFEDNLLYVWEQEKTNPIGTKRNTIGGYFK